MGPSIAIILLALVPFSASATGDVMEGCSDPPWNNEVAHMLVNIVNASREIISSGVPSLGIPPLDPLGPLGRIHFSVDSDNLLLDGWVNDTMIMNLAQFIICELSLQFGVTQKFNVDFRLQTFHMEGKYDVDGIALHLFPVFGNGDYNMNVTEAGISGAAKLSYNPITDIAQIKDLALDVFFADLELEMECILGCGDMADLVNSFISEIAPPLFEAVWNAIDPILTESLENGINELLKNISISEIIDPNNSTVRELGNANGFMDLVMSTVDTMIIQSNLDPAPLPTATLDLGTGDAELYVGQLMGLASLHRSGTCSFDKVASWVFLYSNIAVENLRVHYSGTVQSAGSNSEVEISAGIDRGSVYMVARQDIYIHKTDIDQFVITEFGPISVDIDGLGLLGSLTGSLTEAVANLISEEVANILETQVKQIIQEALDETPWPPLLQ